MISESMRKLGTNRSIIREINEYSNSRAAEIGAENVYNFSIGNPSVEPPQAVTEALIRLVRETEPTKLHAYTSAQGDAGVRRAIAEQVSRTFGQPVNPDYLYLTAGAAAGLAIVLNALLCDGAGEEVLTFAPYFTEYKVYAEKAGAAFVAVPCREPDFQIDFDKLEAALNERTKVVIINSPNNPTGAIFSEDTLRRLGELLGAAGERYGHPIYLLSDEPYRELVYDGATVPYVPAIYPNTVVCYSFSKSLSLPGERLGYILVPPTCCDAADVYAGVLGAGRALGYINVSSLFQYLLPICLDQTVDMTVYTRNRDLLYGALTAYGFTCVKPQGAFYLFLKAPEPDSRHFFEVAKKHEILTVPGDDFGYPGYVRIAYCVSTGQIERSLPAFRALAAEYGLCGKE